MELITTYYTPNNPERTHELQYCLEQNINNPYISHIHLFIDDNTTPPENPKITIHNTTSRPTYKDLTTLALSLPNTTAIIANTDIFFGHTLQLVQHYKHALALTRWEYQPDQAPTLNEGCDSQDAWIFPSTIKIDLEQLDFNFGIPGCDNRYAYELNKIIQVINPATIIKIFHYHTSNYRTYDNTNKVPGEYLQVRIS